MVMFMVSPSQPFSQFASLVADSPNFLFVETESSNNSNNSEAKQSSPSILRETSVDADDDAKALSPHHKVSSTNSLVDLQELAAAKKRMKEGPGGIESNSSSFPPRREISENSLVSAGSSTDGDNISPTPMASSKIEGVEVASAGASEEKSDDNKFKDSLSLRARRHFQGTVDTKSAQRWVERASKESIKVSVSFTCSPHPHHHLLPTSQVPFCVGGNAGFGERIWP